MSAILGVVGLGRMSYQESLELQRSLARQRIEGVVDHDLLLLVEHPPVITLGRGFDASHLAASADELGSRYIDLVEVERGGDVTFHGPGQLVGYPIYDLSEHRQDLHWFLRQIEQGLSFSLDALGIQGERRNDYTGVWTGGKKIASIGIHVKQWVTWHGFALNVTTDLDYFDLIVPCGIHEVEMTSVARELAERTPRDVWARSLDTVVAGFAEVFGQQPQMEEVDETVAQWHRGTVGQ